jgi:nickel/cobalt transporter (NicO) family protein
MPDIANIIQSGAANAWLLLPTALLLGALHALEPGHSKSMMIAFIVAIHGTAKQAALLALSATLGHTIVVWALALLAWRLGDAGVLERAEPWLLLLGGLLLIGLSLSILRRLVPASTHSHGHHHHDHSHGHGHDHAHDYGHAHGPSHNPEHQPHGTFASEDAHAAFHEAQIKKQFTRTTGAVTNGEIAWFGFTGGLLPCPAAFAVLLACLHQKAYGLGIAMVAAFSIGLAAMMVAVGVAAAWGMTAIKGSTGAFDRFARWAPYVSSAVVFLIGLFAVAQGLRALRLL